MKQVIDKDASPRGFSNRRYWLTRTWECDGPVALVIGINPSTATDVGDDAMTRFLSSYLKDLDGEFACGGYILVNCCDLRNSKPESLKTAKEPASRANLSVIKQQLEKCDFVIASWGTTNYGPLVAYLRGQVAAILRQSNKRVICFSPTGKPIYCSQTNRNSKDGRWSDTPVSWCEE